MLGTTVPTSPAVAASSAGTSPGAGAGQIRADLRKSERAGQQTAATACLHAPVARAALAGSIAACRATHAEALR